jgi:hypothetical protein
MNQLERLQYIIRAKSDPTFFLHSRYFLKDVNPYPLQEELFVQFVKGKFKEFIGIGGMGGGKTFFGSLFACYDLFDLLIRENPARDYGLASHSPIFVLLVAKSDEQASDTIFNEVKVKIENSPFFQEYFPRIREYNITFRGHPDIEVVAGGAASAASLAGRNVKCIVFDEICKYDETLSQRGAWQVYTVLRKSTNRFGFDGHVISISSPWHVNDIIMTLSRKQDPHTLVRQFTTWEMNPNKKLESPEMQAELAKDPITFWRDYGCEPHSSLESYYPDLNVIKISERPNLLENGTLQENLIDWKQTYFLALDPSIKNDAFGVALLHKEAEKVIADGLWRFTPKGNERVINPVEMRQFLVYLCQKLPIRYLVTDVWFYHEALEEIGRMGVQVIFKPNRKEEHDEVRHAFFDKHLELCNYPEVREEFGSLLILDSRRIGVVKGGKIDTVDALTRGYWAIQQHLSSAFVPNVVEVI